MALKMSRQTRGWAIVGAFFLAAAFIQGSGFDTTGVFIAPLVKHFGWSRTQVSTLPSMIAIFIGVSAPLIGWLLDRFEARWITAVGSLLAAGAFVIAGTANSYTTMLVAYCTLGVGMASGAVLPCYFVVSNWFSDRRGLALSVSQVGIEVGGTVMALLTAFLIQAHGWRFAYIALALPIVFLVTPPVALLVRNRPPDEGPAEAGATAQAQSVPGLDIGEALAARSFWLIAIFDFCAVAVGTGIVVHLIPYLIGVGFSPTRATTLFSIMLAFQLPGKPALGWLADRIGIRLTMTIDIALIAVGCVLLLGARHALPLGLFVVLYGFTFGAPVPLIPMLLADAVGLKRFGSLMGLLSIPAVVGSASGPIVAGLIFDHTGSYAWSLELFAAMLAVAAVLPMLCIPLSAGVLESAGQQAAAS
ncbi:MAG: MFS transporter [Candidatus Binataceae bacterium]